MEESKKVLAICGAGGSGREILDLARRVNETDSRWSDLIFIDKEDHENEFCGCKVFDIEQVIDAYGKDNIEFIITVGDVYLRQKIFDQLIQKECVLTNLVAPSVFVPESTHLGSGVIIRDFSYISVDVIIESNVMIQPHSCIGHDVLIDKHSIISSQSVLAGGVKIGTRTLIAIGSMIKELVSVGADSIVAMGSIVNKNVDENSIVQGNPAQRISKNYLKNAFRLNAYK